MREPESSPQGGRLNLTFEYNHLFANFSRPLRGLSPGGDGYSQH